MTVADLQAALILRREHHVIRNESVLRRELDSGALSRIAPGVYLPTGMWSRLSDDERYLATVYAAAHRFPGAVFSHRSAAALWRLPIVGRWPQTAEVIAPRAGGGRSTTGLTRYAIGLPSTTTTIDDLRVTTLADTVAAAAAVSAFSTGVAFADRALQTISADELRDAVVRYSGRRGGVRALQVAGFADPLAESAGESLSRVTIEMLGFERPILQQKFFDERGFVARVDFWWPSACVAGEFDGLGKYIRKEWAVGRTPAEVVIDEKRREDRLRGMGVRVVRWGWAEARNPRHLEGLLTGSTVPRYRR